MSSLRELIVCGAEVEACGIDLTPEDEEVEAPTLKTQAAGAVERCTLAYQACLEGCIQEGSITAQDEMLTLISCVNESPCESVYEQSCVSDYCPESYAQCFGGD